MKKKLIMAAVCGISLLLTGCGHDTYEPMGDMTEDTASVSETEASGDDSAEEPVMTEADFDVPGDAAYKYVKTMELSGYSYTTEIAYCNENGDTLLVLSMGYGDEGGVMAASCFENEYDENGHLVKNVQKMIYADSALGISDEKMTTATVLEYYDNGELKQFTTGDSTTVAFEYDYDEQGRPTEVYEYWDGSDELFSTTYKEYDDNGDVVTETISFEGKRSKIDSVTKYEYDEKHRVIREETFMSNSESGSSYVTAYEYTDLK